ncbi:hypothetical protein [Campylobacter upsaliensis]|nr:hypothetical protein [Campylobacter upsaliensis]
MQHIILNNGITMKIALLLCIYFYLCETKTSIIYICCATWDFS